MQASKYNKKVIYLLQEIKGKCEYQGNLRQVKIIMQLMEQKNRTHWLEEVNKTYF